MEKASRLTPFLVSGNKIQLDTENIVRRLPDLEHLQNYLLDKEWEHVRMYHQLLHLRQTWRQFQADSSSLRDRDGLLIGYFLELMQVKMN